MNSATKIIVGYLFFLIAAPLIWLQLPTSETSKANRISQAALALPVGSTKQQIASLIHKEALANQCIYYRSSNSTFDSTSDVQLSGYTSSILSGYFCVYVHNSKRDLIGQCSTYVYFFLDKKDQLLKTATQTRCIGL